MIYLDHAVLLEYSPLYWDVNDVVTDVKLLRFPHGHGSGLAGSAL